LSGIHACRLTNSSIDLEIVVALYLNDRFFVYSAAEKLLQLQQFSRCVHVQHRFRIYTLGSLLTFATPTTKVGYACVIHSPLHHRFDLGGGAGWRICLSALETDPGCAPVSPRFEGLSGGLMGF